jgi:integrase
LTQESVIGWLDDEANNEKNNLWLKANVIRLFGKYLSAIGVDAYVLPSGYASFKSDFTPYILTDEELSLFMREADGLINRRVGYLRDPHTANVIPVLARLLYTCGLRPNEGRLLKKRNINFDTGEVMISETKAHRERIIVMSNDMLDLCKRYDEWRTLASVNSEYFFARSDNNPFNASWLFNIVRQCWRWAHSGIPKSQIPRFRPYDLRHLFASKVLHKWIDEGRDLYAMLPYLRAYMGHVNIEDTVYYIHILPETLLNSPGVNWNKLDGIMPEVGIWEN